MPFQPLPDNSPGKPASIDVGLALLRTVTVFAFVYYQMIGQLSKAIGFIWEREEWDLVTQFESLDLPMPNVMAVAFAAILSIALPGILIGLFSRINGLLLTAIMGIVLLTPLDMGTALTPQAIVLFAGAFLAIGIGGAGKISLDFVLAGRKAKKKKPF